MLKYHGTPITPKDQLARMQGSNFCVSFARPDNLAHCLRIGQSLMLDNGAFSAKTRGEPFDVHGFYAWVEPILSHPHWAVVPDVIDGSVQQQREMVATWPHRREFGIPVWHLGLPIDYLLELCDGWGRVCFGSAGQFWDIGSPAWCSRMDEAFNALARTFGARLPWVHGLRMLGQAAGPWPLASADSTNVAQNFKRDTGCTYCKAHPIDATNPPPALDRATTTGGSVLSINKYEIEFFCQCPNNGLHIHYDLTIETENTVLVVEQIVAATDNLDQAFHEEIADQMQELFGGHQILRAEHHGIHITTTRTADAA